MTTGEILFGVGLTFALAVGSQVIAALARIPALILLLPAGFIAGALTDDIHPDRLLGAAFQPLVSLAVALILYDAGIGLDPRKLQGTMHRVVIRLIVLGGLGADGRRPAARLRPAGGPAPADSHLGRLPGRPDRWAAGSRRVRRRHPPHRQPRRSTG